MTTPWLLFTCGYPFSGKSTLAKSMAEVLDLSLVSVDEHLEFNPIAATAEHDWLSAYKAALTGTIAALGSGRSVIFDSVGHTRKNRSRLRRLADRASARSLLIWLDVPPELARSRLQRNQISPVRPQVQAESFNHIVREFEAPTADEPLIRYHAEADICAWIDDTLRPALVS